MSANDLPDIDELGPVDYLVVEFPDEQARFDGSMLAELTRLVDAGIIRILDLLVLHKRSTGAVDTYEVEDEAADEIRSLERDLAEVLAEEDVLHLAEAMEPDSTAGVLVFENAWAAPFAAAARRAGGQLIASGRIPVQALAASLQAELDELEAELEEGGA